MNFEMSQASTGDVLVVSEILEEAISWMESSGTSLWNRKDVQPVMLMPEIAAGFYFLAWSGGQAAGTFKFQPEDPVYWPEARAGEASYLHRIAIRRAYAGGQLSTAILEWAAGRAKREGHRYLRLDCEASRAKLRAIYERFGFQHHSDKRVDPHFVARYEYAVC